MTSCITVHVRNSNLDPSLGSIQVYLYFYHGCEVSYRFNLLRSCLEMYHGQCTIHESFTIDNDVLIVGLDWFIGPL